MNRIAVTCWKGCQSMSLDVRANSEGLEIWWNPIEVVFQDWMASTIILIGIFCYVGTKKFVFLTIVYGPSTTGDKTSFLEQLVRTKKNCQ